MLKRFIKFIGNAVMRFFRMFIIGVSVFGLIAFNIDTHLKSEYGMTNLYIIIGVLSFFPMLVVLTVEFYNFQKNKGSNIKKLEKDSYLKESTKKNPLTK